MQIKRYKLKRRQLPDYFGKYESTHTWDFEYMFPKRDQTQEELDANLDSHHYSLIDKIGLVGVPRPEKDCFVKSFWLDDNPVELDQYDLDSMPSIKRSGRKTSTLSQYSSGIREVKRLIQFIKYHKMIHVFDSTLHENNPGPLVFTFSISPPSEKKYKYIDALSVKIKDEFVQKSIDAVVGMLPFKQP